MMFRYFRSIAFSFILLLLLSPSCATAQSANSFYTVVFRGQGIPSDAATSVAEAGGQLLRTLPQVGLGVVVASDGSVVARLSGTSIIEAVDAMGVQALPDTTMMEVATASDPTQADNLYVTNQWDIRRVNADQAWAITSGTHDTVVAVIDSGVASNHPDLAPNIVYMGCYALQAQPCNPYPSLGWHGTHVAGTIAAVSGGGSVVGVGPGLGLASYNVFEATETCGFCAFDFPIWEAMIDSAERGFDVINLSLGGYTTIPEQHTAGWAAWNRVVNYVTRQGVTIVASAGNASLSHNGPVAAIPSDLPGVIAVGATGIRPNPTYPQPDAFDVRASYSDFGSAVTLVAPGGDCGPDPNTCISDYWIASTFVLPDTSCAATQSCRVGYSISIGTSMAAPHVAGVAGLLLSHNPGLNPQQVEAILKQAALGLGDHQTFGHGMVDAYAALTR